MTWLSGTLDPDAVLRRLLATVTRVRGGERAWLLLGGVDATSVDATAVVATAVEAAAAAAVVATAVDVPAGDASDALVVTDPDLARLLEVDRPRAYGGEEGWPRPLGEGADRPACWLAVPLVARDERLGVLVLASARPDAYGDADTGIVAALVSQGMVAYENARLFAQVHHLATVDGLTGVANRRHFFDVVSRVVDVARRRQASLAVVMLDIDHFKGINDTFGHRVGDEVIRGVVDRLRRQTRDTDVLARYGGEEFAARRRTARRGHRGAAARPWRARRSRPGVGRSR
nr:sensor domain-containing diguanylate cyclase [Planosporangium thailandense]